MSRSKMYMLTETSKFMMSFVIVTDQDHVIVIDGGRREDLPLLRQYVAGRKIVAWFLTHPHMDHIDAFIETMQSGDPAFDIEAVYCNFPPADFVRQHERAEAHTSDEFDALRPILGSRLHTVQTGDVITADNLSFEVLYSWREEYGFTRNAVNDSSIVLRMTSANTSVLFLADLGPEGGDKLLELSREKLRSDYCQMAHHGGLGVSMDVYFEISPRVCLWPANEQQYNAPDKRHSYRMYYAGTTRRWMERLGAEEHLITKDGTAEIDL